MTTTQWTKTPNPIPRASLEYTSKSIPSWLNWLNRIPMAPTRKVNKPNTSMEIAYCYPIHGDTKKWGSSINGKDVMARGNVNYPFFHLCFKRFFFFFFPPLKLQRVLLAYIRQLRQKRVVIIPSKHDLKLFSDRHCLN